MTGPNRARAQRSGARNRYRRVGKMAEEIDYDYEHAHEHEVNMGFAGASNHWRKNEPLRCNQENRTH